MNPVVDSLPFTDIVIWDNSSRTKDVSCYGRFAGIEEAKHDLIYVQDDDIIVPVAAMLKGYDETLPGVFANKPVDEEWRFLGVGAIFHRDLIADVFDRYVELYGFDTDFCRVCDVVFAYQHPYRHGWFGYGELDWSRAPNRMYHQPDHMLVRERARARTLAL